MIIMDGWDKGLNDDDDYDQLCLHKVTMETGSYFDEILDCYVVNPTSSIFTQGREGK